MTEWWDDILGRHPTPPELAIYNRGREKGRQETYNKTRWWCLDRLDGKCFSKKFKPCAEKYQDCPACKD